MDACARIVKWTIWCFCPTKPNKPCVPCGVVLSERKDPNASIPFNERCGGALDNALGVGYNKPQPACQWRSGRPGTRLASSVSWSVLDLQVDSQRQNTFYPLQRKQKPLHAGKKGLGMSWMSWMATLTRRQRAVVRYE